MTQQSKQILFFLLTALITYACWKFFFDKEPIIENKPFTKGYSVENFELKITDEKGSFSGKFISPNLTRYTDSDKVLITTPKFWTYDKNQTNWLFQSQNAEYDYKKEQVKLIDDVIVKNLQGTENIQLNSKELDIDLNSKIADTQSGVLIQKDLSNLKGQKAKFDLTNSSITVKENVQVVYKNTN